MFSVLCLSQRNKRSKSFLQDIRLLEKKLDKPIGDIYSECNKLKNSLKKTFDGGDGITDSINTCLINFKNNYYKDILNQLTKPKFISEDEEFQGILQYFIINNELT